VCPLNRGKIKPALEETFARLKFSKNATGKLAFVKRLNLLDKRHRRFIKTLSELRNYFAHDIANIDFSLRSYINSLNLEKRNNFIAAISACWGSDLEFDNIRIEPKKFAEENPTWGIWFSTLDLLSAIYVEKELASVEMESLEFYETFFTHFVEIRSKSNHSLDQSETKKE